MLNNKKTKKKSNKKKSSFPTKSNKKKLISSTMTINRFGSKEWKNEKGELHREDGPAIEYADGDKSWYLNGQCHREDGPAIEYIGGGKSWFINGKLHRENGPAVEYANGYKAWYLNDKELSEAEFLKKTNSMKKKLNKKKLSSPVKTKKKSNKKKLISSTMTINKYGDKEWRNEKGELHREDNPAIEYADGDKSWYLNGQRHREDGPAVEYANGTKSWYLNGKNFSEADFFKQKNLIENKSILTPNKDIYVSQTELGSRFGLSAIEVGKYLISCSLKDDKTKLPTVNAYKNKYAKPRKTKDGKNWCLWNEQKIMPGLKDYAIKMGIKVDDIGNEEKQKELVMKQQIKDTVLQKEIINKIELPIIFHSNGNSFEVKQAVIDFINILFPAGCGSNRLIQNGEDGFIAWLKKSQAEVNQVVKSSIYGLNDRKLAIVHLERVRNELIDNLYSIKSPSYKREIQKIEQSIMEDIKKLHLKLNVDEYYIASEGDDIGEKTETIIQNSDYMTKKAQSDNPFWLITAAFMGAGIAEIAKRNLNLSSTNNYIKAEVFNEKAAGQ